MASWSLSFLLEKLSSEPCLHRLPVLWRASARIPSCGRRFGGLAAAEVGSEEERTVSDTVGLTVVARHHPLLSPPIGVCIFLSQLMST